MTGPGPSDPPRCSVELESGPLAYVDEGDPACLPVVAVHGLPGSARDFRWLAPRIAPRARFLRPDLPGFGATPASTGPDPSPEGRARAVLAFVDALGLERPVVLGHSMGGIVACAAASMRPGAFRGLALLATPGLRPHAIFRRYPFRGLSRALALPGIGRAVAILLGPMFERNGFRGHSTDVMVRTMHAAGRTSFEAHAARVRALDLPTLVAWCADDRLIEADIAEQLADACPPGPRLRFDDGGHNLQKTHAAELGEALGAWMSF